MVRNANAEVVLDHIWKVYAGEIAAVRDVSFTIGAGELVVLVGPSGCGKTTTLRMIAGLEDISRGTLSMGGRVVNDVPPRDRDIAMVFQSYALYPHMTVRENMAFGLELRKTPKAEIARRVDEVAKILGLEPYLSRKPKALSGGQRQRVAMGRAIVRQPSVFLFDEPLSNLDAKLRGQVRLEIAALHRRMGATMVYVTHDQVEAMTLADRIAIMSMGELQQFAPPMELYLRPKNRFVAGFLGSPTMNFVDGVIELTGDSLLFKSDSLLLQLPRRHALPAGKATLGFRPQDVSAPGDSATGRVQHLERMGSELIAHVDVGGVTVTLCLPPEHPAAIDEALSFAVAADKAHVFDPNGLTLTLSHA